MADQAETWIVVDPAQEPDEQSNILGVYASSDAAQDALPGIRGNQRLVRNGFGSGRRSLEIQHWHGEEMISAAEIEDPKQP
ncbi:hypothetical protein [Rhodococcus sp. KRD162]|uniref:hypothetical protein n=1 Tax=Rhodococcus sp. KRD162 TaxID=2729725 RepID=UPI0019D04CB4|nr:hypothetical protein [Rhodococcus sp. KRD162]